MRYIIVDENGVPVGVIDQVKEKLSKLMPPGVTEDMLVPVPDEYFPTNKVWNGNEFVDQEPDENKLLKTMFQALAKAGMLTDEQVRENAGLLDEWTEGQDYDEGEYLRRGDELYRIGNEQLPNIE